MVKDKIKSIDDESRTVSVSVMDGDIFGNHNMYPKFEYTLVVTPLVSREKNEDVPHPHEYMEFATSAIKPLLATLPIRPDYVHKLVLLMMLKYY
ncbi:hypothetical protein MKX01_014575 [Papaver californicum]|nr:hypothetical protein MKX01_014575 [Papaver californicum]